MTVIINNVKFDDAYTYFIDKWANYFIVVLIVDSNKYSDWHIEDRLDLLDSIGASVDRNAYTTISIALAEFPKVECGSNIVSIQNTWSDIAAGAALELGYEIYKKTNNSPK